MRVLLLATLCATLLMCRVALAQDEMPPVHADSDAAQANVAVVFAMFEQFGAGDLDAAASFVTEDATAQIYGPTDGAPFYGSFSGRDAIKAMLEDQVKYFDDDAFNIVEVIAAGDRVVFVASQQGHFPNGNAYDNDFILVFTVAEGKISSLRGWEDTAQVAAGLK